jgi:hypothetical protein
LFARIAIHNNGLSLIHCFDSLCGLIWVYKHD